MRPSSFNFSLNLKYLPLILPKNINHKTAMLLHLKVELEGVSRPRVWRKLVIEDTFRFHQLHLAIVYAFGWNGSHLYNFAPRGLMSHPSIECFAFCDEEAQSMIDLDSQKTKVSDFLNTKGDRFTYTYDFGDNWEHQVTVEAVTPGTTKQAILVGGEGKCPPDDIGGPGGYEHFLSIISNSKDPEYKHYQLWAGLKKGQKWDTQGFDLELHAKRVCTVSKATKDFE